MPHIISPVNQALRSGSGLSFDLVADEVTLIDPGSLKAAVAAGCTVVDTDVAPDTSAPPPELVIAPDMSVRPAPVIVVPAPAETAAEDAPDEPVVPVDEDAVPADPAPTDPAA